MKRFLSLLLTAALLCSCCAAGVAEAPAAGVGCYKLSNVRLGLGSTVADLSNLTLELDAATEVDPGAVCLYLKDGDEIVAAIGTTTVDNLDVWHIYSETLGVKNFTIDPVVSLQKLLDSGIAGVVEFLQSIDTHSVAQSIIDSIDSIGEEAPAAEAEAEPEAEEAAAPEAEDDETYDIVIDLSEGVTVLPSITVEGDIVEAISSGITTTEAEHMGGTEYDFDGKAAEIPEGDYETVAINFDTDLIASMLNMVYVDGECLGIGDAMKEAGVEVAITGEFKVSDTFMTGSLSFSGTFDGTKQVNSISFRANLADEDGATIDVTLGKLVGENPDDMVMVAFTLSSGAHEGEVFTAEQLDLTNAIDVNAMEYEDVISELKAAFETLSGDALGAVISPITNAVLDSLDPEDLEALAAALEEMALEENSVSVESAESVEIVK